MRTLLYVPEALFLSMVYRFRMKHRPFLEWSKTLGTRGTESPLDIPADAVIRRISKAVNRTCDHTPWKSQCMVRALTAKKMLNRRGYPCTLYMGVANDAGGSMIAHAWLRVGMTYVTGGLGIGYAVTGIYGDASGKTDGRA